MSTWVASRSNLLVFIYIVNFLLCKISSIQKFSVIKLMHPSLSFNNQQIVNFFIYTVYYFVANSRNHVISSINISVCNSKRQWYDILSIYYHMRKYVMKALLYNLSWMQNQHLWVTGAANLQLSVVSNSQWSTLGKSGIA